MGIIMYGIRRPLVGFAGCFFFGMVLSGIAHRLDQIIFSITLCTWLVACFTKKHRYNFFLWITVLLVGWLYYSAISVSQSEVLPHNPLEKCTQSEFAFTGTVVSEPKFIQFRDSSRGVWRFEMHLRSCDCGNRSLLNQKIDVRVYGWGNEAMPYIQELVVLRGRMEKNSWHEFEQWELNIRSATMIERAPKTGWIHVAEVLRNIRLYAISILRADEEWYKDHAAIQRAVIIGDREGVPYRLRELFKQTGCMHVFAISGLHVGFLILMLSVIIRLLGVPLTHQGWILIPVLIVYAYLTGMRASVLRASLMAIGYLLIVHFREKPDLSNIIALSALLLLVLNPLYSSDAGFLLSYVIVIFILLVFEKFSDQFQKVRGFWFYLLSLCVSTSIATVVSVPLSLCLFGSGSIVGLVANLFVIPMLFFVVFGSWMSLLIPAFSSIFNQASYVCIELILLGLRLLQDLPITMLEVSDVPIIPVCFWYAGCLYLLIWARRRNEVFMGLLVMGFALLLMGSFM